jgi:hypothetical protein
VSILDQRVDGISQGVADATELAVFLTQHEARLSCLALALIARRDFPDSKWLALEDSDQGRWQVCTEVLDTDMRRLDDDDSYFDDEGYASHLYDNVQGTWQGYCAKTAGGRFDSGRWLLDIDKVLAEVTEHPILEILHGREPDSECALDVWIAGEPVPAQQFTMEDMDPGRGYTQEDWDEHTEWVAGNDVSYSPAFREAVVRNRNELRNHKYVN